MESNKTNTAKEQPEDEVFYAPESIIKTIRSVIASLETTRRELQKVMDGMIVIEN